MIEGNLSPRDDSEDYFHRLQQGESTDQPAPSEPVFKAVVIEDAGSNQLLFISFIRRAANMPLRRAMEIGHTPTPFVLVICDQERAETFARIAEEIEVTCRLVDYQDTMQPLIGNEEPFEPMPVGKGCSTSAAMVVLIGTAAVWACASLFT